MYYSKAFLTKNRGIPYKMQLFLNFWLHFSRVFGYALSGDQVIRGLSYIPIEFCQHLRPIALHINGVRPELLSQSLQ